MNYKIQGEPTPVVICDLNANETMITEKGSMVLPGGGPEQAGFFAPCLPN